MGSKKTGITAAFAAFAGLLLFAAAPAHATFLCGGYGYRSAAAEAPAPAVRGYYGRRYGYYGGGVGIGRRYGYYGGGVGIGRRYGYYGGGVGIGRRYGYYGGRVGIGPRYGGLRTGVRAARRR